MKKTAFWASCEVGVPRLPQRLTQVLGEGREHDIEADTDALLLALIRVHGVLKVGRE